jgi:hypothetical protein
MSLLQLPKILLKSKFTKMSLLGTVGGMISRRFFVQKRNRWEKISPDRIETVLEAITAYDIARGAGKLIQGWLEFNTPKITVEQSEKQLKRLLKEMDAEDGNPYEQAKSRLLISKALFYIEGLRWKSCRYEAYQKEVLTLLHKTPVWKTLTRQDIFQAKPFAPEELIGATHRILLTLGVEQLAEYISVVLEKNKLKTELDYMTRLLALTFGIQEFKLFEEVMLQWLADYRDFKLKQVKQQEQWVDTSLSVLSGEAPTKLGLGLLGKVLKKQRPKS